MVSEDSYKKYSLQHLEEWVNDAVNCEDITPQEIYSTITNAIDDNIEYHKKYLTKNIELLSLLKGNRPSVFDASAHEFDDFWYEQDEISQHYSEEDLNAMCDAASDKEKCREYNLREAEYYNKRAELDAHERQAREIAKQVKADGYSTSERNRKTYDQMIEEGWQMTDDGFWIKETEKGTLSISG